MNDITGQTINNFKVLGRAEKKLKLKHRYGIVWKVQCLLCGKITYLIRTRIRRYKSCGCNRVEGQVKSSTRGYEGISLTYWSEVVRSAKKRDIPFELTIEEAWKLFQKQKSKCALTGEPIVFASRSFVRDRTASIDRIDPLKGYNINNIQWVHRDINRMKQCFDEKYFLTLCEKVISFKKKTKPYA